MNSTQTRLSGVTLIELLVAVTIVSLLIVATTISVRTYLARSADAQRKTDLKKMSQALEQYYNDHGGYPQSLAVTPGGPTCGTNTILTPYMKDVPCDPNGGTSRPYVYIPTGSNKLDQFNVNVYQGYRLLTSLEYKADPQIEDFGCPSPPGCGGIPGDLGVDSEAYNFGLTANAPLIVP